MNCSDILLKLKFPIKALFIRYNSDWLNTVSYVSSSSQMCLVSFRSDMLNIWLKIDFLQFKKHVWHSFKEKIPIVSTFLQSELNEYGVVEIRLKYTILHELCVKISWAREIHLNKKNKMLHFWPKSVLGCLTNTAVMSRFILWIGALTTFSEVCNLNWSLKGLFESERL